MTELIQFEYKGSIKNLRARLEKLKTLYPQGWPPRLPPEERLRWYYEPQTQSEPYTQWHTHTLQIGPPIPETRYKTVDITPPTRGTWTVWWGTLPDSGGKLPDCLRGAASIDAFEERPNLVTVIIRNGMWGRTPCNPIDSTLLEEWAQVITEEDLALKDGEEPERSAHPSVRERRERVKAMWENGLTDLEIAKAVCASESTVKRDRKALNLKTKS